MVLNLLPVSETPVATQKQIACLERYEQLGLIAEYEYENACENFYYARRLIGKIVDDSRKNITAMLVMPSLYAMLSDMRIEAEQCAEWTYPLGYRR